MRGIHSHVCPVVQVFAISATWPSFAPERAVHPRNNSCGMCNGAPHATVSLYCDVDWPCSAVGDRHVDVETLHTPRGIHLALARARAHAAKQGHSSTREQRTKCASPHVPRGSSCRQCAPQIGACSFPALLALSLAPACKQGAPADAPCFRVPVSTREASALRVSRRGHSKASGALDSSCVVMSPYCIACLRTGVGAWPARERRTGESLCGNRGSANDPQR